MKTAAALLPEALDHVEEALRAVARLQDTLNKEAIQQAKSSLEQARAHLRQAERQHLEFLGVPSHYECTLRVRLNKELRSWKFWLPVLVLALIVFSSVSVIFPNVPRRFTVEAWGLQIFVPSSLLLAFLLVLIVIVHESLHGLAFLLVGHDRPGFKLRFGASMLYAYATANCALSRWRFITVGLTPLISITVVGIVIWNLVPSWAPWIYFVITMNAVGASGDLWMAWRCLRAHPQALCLDSDYELAIFEPKS
ncbi:MAG: DUF3267 domain-containing protein [Candidatus Bipolaricaulota bacterium]|nr:DUF3267 domain-containing protein [Candidatus Bipolaricaulota bacterium]MDW8030675.1 DUF3267 domain-containing protein [Candidatus Bipolaricaulota bacterium]